jgi:hypothetical protein
MDIVITYIHGSTANQKYLTKHVMYVSVSERNLEYCSYEEGNFDKSKINGFSIDS